MFFLSDERRGGHYGHLGQRDGVNPAVPGVHQVGDRPLIVLGNGHRHQGEGVERRPPAGPAPRGRSPDHAIEHLREPSFQPTVEVIHL